MSLHSKYSIIIIIITHGWNNVFQVNSKVENSTSRWLACDIIPTLRGQERPSTTSLEILVYCVVFCINVTQTNTHLNKINERDWTRTVNGLRTTVNVFRKESFPRGCPDRISIIYIYRHNGGAMAKNKSI